MDCACALDLPRPTPPGLPLVVGVAVVLIDADGRVLVAQRPEGKALAGKWEFPGGKLEVGEPPEFALMRELAEELGIETRPTCFTPIGFASYAYETFHLLMPLFACRTWRGTPTGLEGQAVKWVRPQELYAIDMPPADIPLIPQLLDYLAA